MPGLDIYQLILHALIKIEPEDNMKWIRR